MRHEADIVVIGSGSAGAVVAGRLAQAGRRVLVIEAGARDRNPLYRVPLMTGILLRRRRGNWFYQTQPEPGLTGRRLFWPRGKVLGGCSAINGMVWTRGFAADYDGWAQSGLTGWDWESVLPVYRGLERHWAGDTAHHGGQGGQPLSRIEDLHPLSQAFLEAGREVGLPLSEDFNGASAHGVGRYDFTIEKGRRVSAARAFLVPQEGAGLRVLTGALATRILFDGPRATGVEIRRGEMTETVHADQVVVCGGTVNTPQLLMLSGIGPADDLSALDIPVIADLPGVGRNMQDHLLVRVEYDCREPVTLHRLLRADRAALALAQALATGTGPAARFPLEVGAFLKSDPALDLPDLQSHFLPGRSTAAVRMPFRGAANDPGHGFFANVYQMRPDSRGRVRLRSTDPADAPLIEGNYLTAPRDIAVLRAGVRALRDIFGQPAFDRWRGDETQPGAARQSDADLDAWIRATADTVFHPVGTCRMGVDANAVVDPTLAVHGIAGLRVADASVIPTMASCNTHAPTMMIGARAADFILSEAEARQAS